MLLISLHLFVDHNLFIGILQQKYLHSCVPFKLNWIDAVVVCNKCTVVSQDKTFGFLHCINYPECSLIPELWAATARQCTDLECSIICVTIRPINYLSRCTSLRAIIPFDIAKVRRNNSCVFFPLCVSAVSVIETCRVCSKWMSCAYSVNNSGTTPEDV